MTKYSKWTLVLVVQVIVMASVRAEGDQQFAEFDDCPLVSGEVIRDCRLGYRTFGQLNETRSNALLFPSWYGGTSEDLVSFGYIGPGLLADSASYFVIVVDAFGNGVSSSPSNSKSQHGADFPALRIEDMVVAEHRLLVDVLAIPRLHAVIGISMGGMQTLEWAVRFPAFMDKAVSIVGTPRQTSYDLLLWHAQLEAIQEFADDDYESAVRIIAALGNLTLSTPSFVASNTPATAYQDYVQQSLEMTRRYGLENRVPQLEAMIHHDISARFGGSMQMAAEAVDADLLIVISPEDHVVNPIPSREFAGLAGARLHELPGACGHIAVACEKAELTEVVMKFLQEPAPARAD
jgi:homoserine O-acetyltransferase/O-succinyltransferase